MSGFADTILSFLLSWIRALVNSLWTVFTSEDGGMLYRLLSRYWLAILIALCIAGFVIDRVVYLLRWRPHYIWLSRRDRRRERKPAPQTQAEPEPVYQETVYQDQTQVYRRPAVMEEPLFDEPVELWDDPQWQSPSARDPNAYFRDVQSGFAPPIPPEELYAPRAAAVHPGLDEQTFRHSLGLPEQTSPPRRRYQPSSDSPNEG